MNHVAEPRQLQAKLRYRDPTVAPEETDRNRQAVLAAFDAVAMGDGDPFWALFDDAVVFHEAESLPYGGTFHGIEAVRAAHARIRPYFDRLDADIEQVLAAGDMVLAYLQLDFRVAGNGRSGSMPVTELYRFRDGRIIEWRALYFDAGAIAAALAAD